MGVDVITSQYAAGKIVKHGAINISPRFYPKLFSAQAISEILRNCIRTVDILGVVTN